MLGTLDAILPRQVLEIGLVLFLSFLLGLEREEHKATAAHYVFGGVRTFPMIGLLGYGLARISSGNVLSLAIGLAVVGALMVVSYAHKVREEAAAGATTEVSGLLTYLLGALVCSGAYWAAVALGIVAVLLLELREALETLTSKVGRDEVAAFTKFLVLAVVILPVLPNRSFTRFDINPFRTWLVLVAVSGLSYVSYVLQRWRKGRGGVQLTALLGGAYSSTATTMVLARRSREADRTEGSDRQWTGTARLYAGSTLAASGVMYVRMLTLVFLFDRALAGVLAPAFAGLAAVAILAGIGLGLATQARVAAERSEAKRAGLGEGSEAAAPTEANPLELRPAFLFTAAFVVVLVLTKLALEHVGRGALYGLAALMGLADVDPFVLGVAQSGGRGESLHMAASAVAIAASANNVAKGLYARVFAERKTGTLALALLFALAALGLVPIAWM
jgi:uncharacterized membrane protein (DUF4010 family)